MLYSHFGNPPAPLPPRIRLADGTTRTDPSTFTEQEIADAGYVAKPQPEVVDAHISWVNSDWLVVPFTQEEKTQRDQDRILNEWQDVRVKRNIKLASTDWQVLKAIERGESVDLNLSQYRQALRDITKQPDPFNIIWPEYIPLSTNS